MTANSSLRRPRSPRQGPKKRNARRIQICPKSEEQRERWEAAAEAAGAASLSAWLVLVADEALARSAPKSPTG
jgi:hypothetical protein